MTAPPAVLDRARLRADLERTAFASAGMQRDAFALECEGFAVRWRDDALPLAIGLHEPLEGSRTLADVVREVAAPAGWQVHLAGDAQANVARTVERGSFAFGHGGQVAFRSAASTNPSGAWREVSRALDALEVELARLGAGLVSLGSHPWSDAAAHPGDAGRLADLHLSAATRVHVGFGGLVHRDSRWNAAHALSNLVGAIFAAAPLARGSSTGLASVRLARRRLASRRGDPELAPADEYLERALDARVLLAGGRGRLPAQPRDFTFREWLEQGIDGVRPLPEDWVEHLSTLSISVRPQGWLVLDAQDALPRPFRCVPLVLWSALLEDGWAQARAVEIASPVSDRVDSAASTGIAEIELSSRARSLFAVAADVLLRRPPGWVTNEMLAAFVAYGQRFVSRSRTPADDVIDTFSSRGIFDKDEYGELVATWEREAGMAPLARR